MSAERELTTSEAAAEVGISVDLLRKYKARGFLPASPQGISGQGRGIQCMWSIEAVRELRAFVAQDRPVGKRIKP